MTTNDPLGWVGKEFAVRWRFVGTPPANILGTQARVLSVPIPFQREGPYDGLAICVGACVGEDDWTVGATFIDVILGECGVRGASTVSTTTTPALTIEGMD